MTPVVVFGCSESERATEAIADRMSACADVLMLCMKASRLQENSSKIEVTLVMLVWPSSAPDTYHIGTNQDHRRAAAGHLGP